MPAGRFENSAAPKSGTEDILASYRLQLWNSGKRAILFQR